MTSNQYNTDLSFLIRESSVALSAIVLIAKTLLAIVALETEQVMTLDIISNCDLCASLALSII